MTETTEAPRIRRALTVAEYGTEAVRRFGPNSRDWAFRCPGCGDVATPRDFPEGQGERAGQDCVGRHRDALPDLPIERGCPRAANGHGLVQGPWLIRLDDGTTVGSFPLADRAPSRAPQSAPQTPGGTPGPERTDRPPAPRVAPARALCVERRQHPAPAPLSGECWLDMENWDYRVALTQDQALLGYRDAEPDRPVTVMFADTAQWMCDSFHDLAPDLQGALRHISAFELPITEARLVLALSLIVQAHSENLAAERIPAPSQEFLRAADGPRPFVHDA